MGYEDDFDLGFIGEHRKVDLQKVDRVKLNNKMFLSADKILEIINELKSDNIGRDGSHEYESACQDFKAAIMELKGGEYN